MNYSFIIEKEKKKRNTFEGAEKQRMNTLLFLWTLCKVVVLMARTGPTEREAIHARLTSTTPADSMIINLNNNLTQLYYST